MGIPRFGTYPPDRGTFPVAGVLSVDRPLPTLLHDQTVTQTERPHRWKLQSARRFFLRLTSWTKTRSISIRYLSLSGATIRQKGNSSWTPCKIWSREACCEKTAPISTAAQKAGG